MGDFEWLENWEKENLHTNEAPPKQTWSEWWNKDSSRENAMLDDIKHMASRMSPKQVSMLISKMPVPFWVKTSLHFLIGKQRRPSGPSVKKRPNMAYGTRRKRAYTPRRRAYSKKSRKVYRKKPVSKRRSNASNATMSLIWKAMKSRI